MKNLFVLFLLSLVFNLNAFDDLTGLCAEAKTSLNCTVINQTGVTVSRIEWLLEGDWADYGNEVNVNLKNGQSIEVTNVEGADNCFFTEYTWLSVETATGDRDYFDDGTIQFDNDDNCTITLK